MGLYAAELLGLELPRKDKRLLAIAETDGCMLDGLSVATGCRVGNRTLRILDFGKVAATFVDIYTETSIRINPSHQSRTLAVQYATEAPSRWEAMLIGYRVLAAEALFNIRPVYLKAPLMEIIGKPNQKTRCESCGEEIMNGREVLRDDLTLCCACADESYYELKATPKLFVPREGVFLDF
jgi:formylmethanofuran dehydrogenase subunit E